MRVRPPATRGRSPFSSTRRRWRRSRNRKRCRSPSNVNPGDRRSERSEQGAGRRDDHTASGSCQHHAAQRLRHGPLDAAERGRSSRLRVRPGERRRPFGRVPAEPAVRTRTRSRPTRSTRTRSARPTTCKVTPLSRRPTSTVSSLKNFIGSATEVPLSAPTCGVRQDRAAAGDDDARSVQAPTQGNSASTSTRWWRRSDPYLTPDESATLGQIAREAHPDAVRPVLRRARRLSSRRPALRSTCAQPNRWCSARVRRSADAHGHVDTTTRTCPRPPRRRRRCRRWPPLRRRSCSSTRTSRRPQSVADIAGTVKSNRCAAARWSSGTCRSACSSPALVALVVGGFVLWHRHSSQPLDVRARPAGGGTDPRTRAHTVGDVPMSAPVERADDADDDRSNRPGLRRRWPQTPTCCSR